MIIHEYSGDINVEFHDITYLNVLSDFEFHIYLN